MLKKGKIFTEFQSYVIEEVQNNKIICNTESGQKVTLTPKYVEKLLSSADDYKDEEKLTMTELAEKFTSSSRIAMTVAFYKKDKKKTKKAFEAEIAEKVKEVQEAPVSKVEGLLQDLLKNPVSQVIPGELRVMKGYHYGSMNELGRVNFVDREWTEDHNIRQVDPRTIKYVIVDKVKYSLK